MADDQTLTYGHGRDKALEALENAYGGYGLNDDVHSLPWAMRWLDAYYGIAEDGDYVVMTPGYGMWLLMGGLEFIDPEIADLALRLEAGEGEDVADAFESRLTSAPMMVRFTPDAGKAYELTNGEPFGFRILTDEQAESGDYPAVTTVRADGTLIRLPKKVTKLS